MTDRTYHLLNDFCVYKQTLKRNFYDNDRDETVADVEKLLKERRQRYTLAEIKRLFLFLWTAHDDCVCNNREDFHPLQFKAARRKVRFGRTCLDKVKRLEEEANA